MTQTVDAAFTAEERDTTRKIVGSLKVAWKKQYRSTITFFTIGTSRTGGASRIRNRLRGKCALGSVPAWLCEAVERRSVGCLRALHDPR